LHRGKDKEQRGNPSNRSFRHRHRLGAEVQPDSGLWAEPGICQDRDALRVGPGMTVPAERAA